MTTNQTIDGVPRELLERIAESGGYVPRRAELRALLDADECCHEFVPFQASCTKCGIPYKPAAQPQGEPVGYVLAKQTAVEVPGQGRKELGYTLLDGIGVFRSAAEVHAAIAELGLPLGWVSMTVDQLLPGYMIPADAEQPAPVAVLMPTQEDFERFIIRRDGSVNVSVMGKSRFYNDATIDREYFVWLTCLDEVTRLNPSL